MANSKTHLEHGLQKIHGGGLTLKFKAAAALLPHRLVSLDASGNVVHAEAEQLDVVGAVVDRVAANDRADVIMVGPVVLTAEVPVTAGQPIAAGNDGKAQPLVTADIAVTEIDAVAAGGNFGNQPANDGVEIVSDNAGDTTQNITVYYNRNGQGDLVFSETVALNGTTQVALADTDVTNVLGFELDAVAAGTVTVREASANATIGTLTTGNLQAGVQDVVGGYAYNVAPTVVAGGASTKQIGLVGTDENGAAIMDSQALNGTTAVTMNDSFNTVTKVLFGDLATATTATVNVGAVEVTLKKVGLALESQADADGTFLALLGH